MFILVHIQVSFVQDTLQLIPQRNLPLEGCGKERGGGGGGVQILVRRKEEDTCAHAHPPTPLLCWNSQINIKLHLVREGGGVRSRLTHRAYNQKRKLKEAFNLN